jgi:hypothetical protein
MIQMECTVCGAPLQFHESAAGSHKACPQCKSVLKVPDPAKDRPERPKPAH